jgi:hypothetical protein
MNAAELCLALMRADTEDEVVTLLTDAGYWSDRTSWRYLGDSENNFSTIGNQQSEAVAALVEKIVNGGDARLINACLEAGIDPTSTGAPSSIREAVARFFEGRSTVRPERDGRLAEWDNVKATFEGRLLTVAATGNKPIPGQPGRSRPSISIADAGEGQTPDDFPLTFLSLMRSNKLRVHFVQGKFNMGGTGALNFCSEKHRLQLIVSRRNPNLLSHDASERDLQWGFTVVRRQAGEEGARSSVYTYLAPEPTPDGKGGVRSFAADEWPIFPDDPTGRDSGADAYVRTSTHGSLVKLYEYAWQGTNSNIVQSGGGLLRRLDLALPELALPVRLFECRPYGGGTASFSTNALGLVSRLERDRASNLEDGFPVGGSITLSGHQIPIRIYAFKAGRADEYRLRSHGAIFTVNGQMHAAFPIDFFRRKAVNLSYVADSILVVLDCSGINEQMREDLFMNSRDRLKSTQLAIRLEDELERLLKDDPALRALQNRRREERAAQRLEDDKPLAEVLQGLLRSNPLLSKLFRHGLRLSAPFPPSGGTAEGKSATFLGKQFPTYFRFKGRQSGETLRREAGLGSRVRVAFDTDAADDYFIRESSPGAWRLLVHVGEEFIEAPDWTFTNPRDGVAQMWISSLPDGVKVGDEVRYRTEVTDDSRTDAIVNDLTLVVVPEVETGTRGGGRSRGQNSGAGDGGSGSQLALPPITPVSRDEWPKHGFDEFSALKVVLSDSEDGVDAYDFYVNVDNRYLKVAQKETRTDPALLERQFIYGLVLLGLALLQDQRNGNDEDDDAPSDSEGGVEALVARSTKAIAPILLPMIDAIGGLVLDD